MTKKEEPASIDGIPDRDLRFSTLMFVVAALNDLSKEVKRMRVTLERTNYLAQEREERKQGRLGWPWTP